MPSVMPPAWRYGTVRGRLVPGDPIKETRDGCPGFHRADGGGLRPARSGSEGGGEAVNVDNLVGLVLAVLVAVLLVIALLFPERF